MARIRCTFLALASLTLSACTGQSQAPTPTQPPATPSPSTTPNTPAPTAEATAAQPPAEAVDPVKAQIEHIRTLYGAALALPAQKMVFDCEDDHASGTFLTRHKDTQLLWARYAMGYEHGGMSFEMLFEGNQVLFVLKENNSWSFDQASDLPDDGGGTVDTISQARYYYREGTLIRALHKEASARSILNEELQVGLEKAENKPHKTADGPKILETAQRLHKAHLQHEITEQWCGI